MAAITSDDLRNPGGPPILRRFVQVGDRRVHYLRSGEGPPLVLIHASPYNGAAWLGGIRQWSRRFTCFAFDSPGFGESDPLPPERMDVMGITDAMAETIHAMKLPRCAVVGSHTGAAVALELGVQHPDLFTGVVLEGLPLFTQEELRDWFTDEYFATLKVSAQGEHLTWAWTRVRDADQYFPWIRREPRYRYAEQRGSAGKLHSDVMDYYLCAADYVPAYRSACAYGDQCVRSLAALDLPALITASSADLMFAHMDRLPPLKPAQRMLKLGPDPQHFHDAVEDAARAFAATADAAPDAPTLAATSGIGKQFFELPSGQVMLRHAGERAGEAILMLHDAPGTALALEAAIAAAGQRAFVLAPDLPGCGDSDPLAGSPTADDIADHLLALLHAAKVERAAVYGEGIGALLAIALKARAPERIGRLALVDFAHFDAEARAALRAHYAPPLVIQVNGSHWYDLWLMLRDSLSASPWHDGSKAALRRPELPCDAVALHRWTVEVMKQPTAYAQVIEAAFALDPALDLDRYAGSVVASGGDAPFAAGRLAGPSGLGSPSLESARRETLTRLAAAVFEGKGPAR